MHPHEKQIIRTFFLEATRDRYLRRLGNERRRSKALDDLNHLWDLDKRYVTRLSNKIDALEALRSRGAPAACYVLSYDPELDGKEMPLAEAIHAAESGDWGTIIGCIPGRLAYYAGENCEQRAILERGSKE